MPEASLRKTTLIGASLRKATLIRAKMSEANLWMADLREANLFGADLSKADLREADLWGANLDDTLTLKDTNLHKARGLTKEKLAICKAKGAIIYDTLK